MGEERDDDEGGAGEDRPPRAKEAKGELFAALGHLRNAAEILVGAADPAVRKAAAEAERVLQKVGQEAEPVAQKVGAELGRMTRSIVEAIEGKPARKDGEPDDDAPEETDVERLEREAEAKKPRTGG